MRRFDLSEGLRAFELVDNFFVVVGDKEKFAALFLFERESVRQNFFVNQRVDFGANQFLVKVKLHPPP